MKSPNIFSVSFFLKKDKMKESKAPLFVRITLNGKFSDISTKKRVVVSAWNQNRQMLSGNGNEEELVREKIRLLTNDINKLFTPTSAFNFRRHVDESHFIKVSKIMV